MSCPNKEQYRYQTLISHCQCKYINCRTSLIVFHPSSDTSLLNTDSGQWVGLHLQGFNYWLECKIPLVFDQYRNNVETKRPGCLSSCSRAGWSAVIIPQPEPRPSQSTPLADVSLGRADWGVFDASIEYCSLTKHCTESPRPSGKVWPRHMALFWPSPQRRGIGCIPGHHPIPPTEG